MTETQREKMDELTEAFELLDDWEDRYSFLIDLGRRLPPLSDSDRSEENKIKGCQSQVWIVPETSDPDKVVFTGDSDSAFVKGLVGILYGVYSKQPKADVRDFDIDGLLNQLGLSDHLSMNRRNGLAGMIQRIRALAN